MKFCGTIMALSLIFSAVVSPVSGASGSIQESMLLAKLAEETGISLGEDRASLEKEPFPPEVLRKVGWAKRFRVMTRDGELIESKMIPDIGFNEVASINISKRTYAAKVAGQVSAVTAMGALMIMITGVDDSQFVIKADPAYLFLGVVGSALVGGVIGSFFREWETVYVAGRRR
ncbi:hypothetical protein ACFLT7_08515, partial [candidate division KSB1 bacterium]